jgi:HlyD family secretion protein
VSWWRKIGWVVGVVAVVGAIALGFMPSPVLVDTDTVARGSFEVTVREEGKTRVIERYTVSAPVAAYARRVELDVGDGVGEGEVLLYLEPLRSQVLDPRTRAEAQARVAAADAALSAARQDVDGAEADADFAAAELERLRQLFARGAVAQTVVEQAEATAQRTAARREAARRAVEVAEYDLEAARAALRYSDAGDDGGEAIPVRSPVDGNVLAVAHESEGVVSPGEPLLEVGDPSLLEVEVEVLSSDAVKISQGTPVRFERWGGDGDLEGVVRVVEPVGFTKFSALGVEEQRVRVLVDFTSPREQWERLGDQYRVEAVFIVWRGDDVLNVPSSALFRRGDGWATFVLDGDHVSLRAVEVGRSSGLRTQVTGGLSEGDVIVVHPDSDLEDGSAVETAGG